MAEKGPRPYHAATMRSPTRNGLLPGEWQDPKYPGDAGLNLDVSRGDDVGMVRVQVYGPEAYMVASYTPGYVTSFPGDSPKMNPDQSTWCETRAEASQEFINYVIRAFRAGWKPARGLCTS